MEIDTNTMISQLLEAITTGVNWMITIKSPSEPEFILWVLAWIPIVISVLLIGLKITKSSLGK